MTLNPRMRWSSRLAIGLLAALSLGPLTAHAKAAESGDEDTKAEATRAEEARRAAAEEVNLDLDERIRPVSGFLFLKDGRHEFSPSMQLSLNDAFFTKYVFGLSYDYHITEQWSAGARFGYAMSTPSGAVAKCGASGEACRIPSKKDLERTPGDFVLLAGLDVAWSPLYGKISVLAEQVLHFDTYAVVGGGAIQSRMVPPGSKSLEEKMLPEVHLGIGQRYFLGRTVALRFELRDVIYQLDVQGKNGVEGDLQNQLLFSLGLSFFLGEMPES